MRFRRLAVLAVLAACGCQSARVDRPLTTTLAGDASAGEFWYRLASEPVVANDDALHAVLLYVDGRDGEKDYAGRVRSLARRGLLPAQFGGDAGQAVDRGTLAVALVKALDIHGGLTMALTGATPRYATRALVDRGIYPPSSPNQGLSGAEFVGIMQKVEEFQRGSPADAPAAFLPGEIAGRNNAPTADRQSVSLIVPADVKAFDLRTPAPLTVYLEREADASDRAADATAADGAPATRPVFLIPEVGAATQPAGIRHLNVIVTGVEGDLAEVRPDGSADWKKARRGMVLHENAEFRTGPKSAVRFIIPPDQTFALDSDGLLKVLQAAQSGKRVKTDIGLERGRAREDLDHAPPEKVEEAGLEHDTTIRSPNSALALRGTKVSLFDQAAFPPEAISLTGRAVYVNTRGQRVPFGGTARTAVQGAQTGAVQQSSARANALQSGNIARLDFETREISLVNQRGGFVRGDVIVGNLHLSDFGRLPGALDFVLQWSGGPRQELNDLNLAVFSPLNSRTSPDFVANPPFTVSLNPSSPASIAARANSYPRVSRSGGEISRNSVGPDGLELADWPKGYPTGTYRVVVYNLLDASPPPARTINPVTFTIDVYLNGRKLINTYTGSVGLLQTSPALRVPVGVTSAPPAPAAAVSHGQRRPR